MNEKYFDFVGMYQDVVPAGYCQHMVSEFERLQEEGIGTNRWKAEGAPAHRKDDHAMFLDTGAATHFKPFEGAPVLAPFYAATQACFDAYTTKYSVLKEGSIRGTTAKMQKTEPGQGYHVWHGEQSGGMHAARVLTYMLYLNSFEPSEGGETEFLYQKARIAPEENCMLMWPAAFTHAHRGNTVLGSRAKYIITGWFYFD